MLRLYRYPSYADRLRAYKVLVDGEVIGQIRQRERLDFPVSGRHTLQLRVDWCASPEVVFESNGGTIAEFECGSNLSGWRVWLALFYVLFRRNDYIRLYPSGSG